MMKNLELSNVSFLRMSLYKDLIMGASPELIKPQLTQLGNLETQILSRKEEKFPDRSGLETYIEFESKGGV